MSTFLAIDFETANPDANSACAIGLVLVTDGEVVSKTMRLIRPPSRDFFFTNVHGLTWDDVADEPDFPRVWADIAPLFDGVDFVAAHNVRFDRRVLFACCETYGLLKPEADFVCTVHVARAMWDLRPTGLAHCARFLCVPLDHHEALSDAHACAQIVIAAEIDGWRGPRANARKFFGRF